MDDFIILGFQSTLPEKGATCFRLWFRIRIVISIHAPREGSDSEPVLLPQCAPAFQSTLPEKGATLAVDFNPGASGISIHAPREGSDFRRLRQRHPVGHFNPRSPRRERLYVRADRETGVGFQSTLPEKGATHRNFAAQFKAGISIHAPREGSDFHLSFPPTTLSNFNPRSPRRERPAYYVLYHRESSISIHAPREGSDVCVNDFGSCFVYFNPRSPRRERPIRAFFCRANVQFQSTLPEKGATQFSMIPSPFSGISIHAPREGSDTEEIILQPEDKISIHAPREGSDSKLRTVTLVV